MFDEELAITNCRSSLGTQALAVKFWQSRINDPFTTSTEIFTARRWEPTKGYANPALDKLIDDKLREHDLIKRAAGVQEAQRILLDDAVCGLLRSTRRQLRKWGRRCHPKPAAADALSSQYCVCPSLQPGTAKCVGAPTCSRGSTAPRRCARKWIADGLKRCIVAALVEAHKAINRPNATTERIVFAPLGLPLSTSMRYAREILAPIRKPLHDRSNSRNRRRALLQVSGNIAGR